MYVHAGGRVFTAPFGSEYLGLNSEGIPMALWRGGWIGEMVEVASPQRSGLGKGRHA